MNSKHVPHQASTAPLPHIFMLNANQMATIARFSRSVAFVSNFEDLFILLTETLKTLDITGLVRLNCVHFKKTGFIGGANEKETYCYLRKIPNITAKIFHTEKYIIFSSQSLLLTVDKISKDQQTVDCLVDNLAILFDITDKWMENQSNKVDLYIAMSNERAETSKKIEDALSKIKNVEKMAVDGLDTIHSDLLSSLIASFPKMGMEEDQESGILNLIDAAMNKYERFIDNQLKLGNDVSLVLLEARKTLTNDMPDDLIHSNQKRNVDIDPNVTLF